MKKFQIIFGTTLFISLVLSALCTPSMGMN